MANLSNFPESLQLRKWKGEFVRWYCRLITFFLAILILCLGCSPYFWQGFSQGYQASQSGKTSTGNSYGSAQHKCPSCNMSMYSTGESKIEWGRIFYLYECPAGHSYWFPTEKKKAPSKYVKNPCPVCGMGTYFTGETYIEWGKLFKVYECPVGHESVRPSN